VPSSSQAFAVVLAFVAAAVSLAAAGVHFVRTGSIRITLLIGGLLMLTLGIAGSRKLKS
jgi:hypothetical protein